MNSIKIESSIQEPVSKVWKSYIEPSHIVNWNFASDDWCCPKVENDVRVGGKLKSRMEAKDGSFGFDFVAEYTEVKPQSLLVYMIADGRKVATTFEDKGLSTLVTTIFEPETTNPPEMQKAGWQSILNNFKKYTESI